MIPKEGALLWREVLAMPADMAHVDGAYRLIDHLPRPQVVADFTNAPPRRTGVLIGVRARRGSRR